MPMLLIQGFCKIKDSQPDGDTVHFTAADPKVWPLVGGGRGRTVKHTDGGRAKLRLDAVDAPETYFGPNHVHQPLQFAHAARDELLRWLGFTDVHGRCIALAGRGTAPGTSGLEIDVDEAALRTTVNHHLLAQGLAYPTFYRTLFTSLRVELATVSKRARDDGRGLWPSDATLGGAKITGPASLTDDALVLAKLFRRLVDYLRLGMPMSCDPAFLAGAGDCYSVLSIGGAPGGRYRGVDLNEFLLGITGTDTVTPVTFAQDGTPPVPGGDVGPTVYHLGSLWGIQEGLAVLGYDPGRIDGLDGPRTQAAVSAFQGDQALPQDGVCAGDTLLALAAALQAKGFQVAGV